ncbi:hypothetical protein, partial [Bacillus phage SPG24]
NSRRYLSTGCSSTGKARDFVIQSKLMLRSVLTTMTWLLTIKMILTALKRSRNTVTST